MRAMAEGPHIELPPAEASESQPTASGARLQDLIGTGRRLGIGGYGEAYAIFDGDEKRVTLRRFVFFAGYRFNDWARVYAELELENGNQAEMEQAYLELEPRRYLGFRAGLLLVPIGLTNLFHEPPTFNRVERFATDVRIIPSTWRELGAGIYGTPIDGLHYQLYAMSGLDGDRFTADTLLAPGRGNGQNAQLHTAAVAGRINCNRLLGLDVAFSFYYGGAGQDVAELAPLKVGIVEADARFSRWGLSARAEYTRLFISGAGTLTNYQRAKDPTVAALPSAAEGFYGEVGYDVLHLVKRVSGHQLDPFVGYEYVNPHAENASGIAFPGQDESEHLLTMGIAYRPHAQIAIKLSYERRLAQAAPPPSTLLAPVDPEAAELALESHHGPNRVTVGVGFMF
jgi:hypothetical protein